MTLARRLGAVTALALLGSLVPVASGAAYAAVPSDHSAQCAEEGVSGALTLVRKSTDRGGAGTSRATFGAYVYRGSDAAVRCVVVEVRAAGNKRVENAASTASLEVDVPGDATAETGEVYVGLAGSGSSSTSMSGSTSGLAAQHSLSAVKVAVTEQAKLDEFMVPFLPIALKPLADMTFTFARPQADVSVSYEATATKKAKPVKRSVAAKARKKEVAAAKAAQAATVAEATAERDALLATAATQTGLLAEWTTFYASAIHLTTVEEARGAYKAAVKVAKRRERLAVKGTTIVTLHDHEFAVSLPLA